MSKAFTKEDDGSGPAEQTDLPQSTNPNYITPDGLEGLRSRLDKAETEVEELRAQGDKADTAIAIAAQEREIRFLHDRIGKAIITDPHSQPEGVVAFGAEVDVTDEAGDKHTFRILGEDEADPAHGQITPFSPLGRALIGGETGTEVTWNRPKGNLSMKITAIRFP